jgi:DNA (cytosine-5)-methyltransferase 1
VRYLSVCSGIEAATVAWHPLGWRAAAFSEIEAFPRAVLAHHYPDTPCHGDFTTIGADDYGPIDLLVGGTPCQSFSVAGLRGGLDDDRGNLALEYLRLADRKRPRWLVWENVPGVLSSNGGRDFGSILGGMVELGYHGSYRVLDAQFFGVPQRRRRVFVVGYLGDWRRAAAVLFERHSLSGHPAPRREKGPSVAALTANGVGTCGADDNQGQAGHLIARSVAIRGRDGVPQVELGDDVANAILTPNGGRGGIGVGAILEASTGDTAHCLNAGGMGRQDYETETLIAIQEAAGRENTEAGPSGAGYRTDGQAYTLEARHRPQAVCFTAKDHGADASDISPTLRSGSHSGSHANGGVMPAVAFEWQRGASQNLEIQHEFSPALIKSQTPAVMQSAVRRLTPRECERLQGFPDDYTLIPYRGKQAADGPRYKALGNSMAVPVMRWIGERIQLVESLSLASMEAA